MIRVAGIVNYFKTILLYYILNYSITSSIYLIILILKVLLLIIYMLILRKLFFNPLLISISLNSYGWAKIRLLQHLKPFKTIIVIWSNEVKEVSPCDRLKYYQKIKEYHTLAHEEEFEYSTGDINLSMSIKGITIDKKVGTIIRENKGNKYLDKFIKDK